MTTFYECVKLGHIERAKTFNLDRIPIYVIHNAFRRAYKNNDIELVDYLLSSPYLFKTPDMYHFLNYLNGDSGITIIRKIVDTRQIIPKQFLEFVKELEAYKYILSKYPDTSLSINNLEVSIDTNNYKLYKYIISKISEPIDYKSIICNMCVKNIDIARDICSNILLSDPNYDTTNLVVNFIDYIELLEYVLSLNNHNITECVYDESISINYSISFASIKTILDHTLKHTPNKILVPMILHCMRLSKTMVDIQQYLPYISEINIDLLENIFASSNIELLTYIHTHMLRREFTMDELEYAADFATCVDMFKYVYTHTEDNTFSEKILSLIVHKLEILRYMLIQNPINKFPYYSYKNILMTACYTRSKRDNYYIICELYNYGKRSIIYTETDFSDILMSCINKCGKYGYFDSIDCLLTLHSFSTEYYKLLYRQQLDIVKYCSVDFKLLTRLITLSQTSDISENDLLNICTHTSVEILDYYLKNIQLTFNLDKFVSKYIDCIIDNCNFAVAYYLIHRFPSIGNYSEISLALAENMPYYGENKQEIAAYNILYEIVDKLSVSDRERMLLNTKSLCLFTILLKYTDYHPHLYYDLYKIEFVINDIDVLKLVLPHLQMDEYIYIDIITHAMCKTRIDIIRYLCELAGEIVINPIVCHCMRNVKVSRQLQICEQLGIGITPSDIILSNFAHDSINTCCICYSGSEVVTECGHSYCAVCLSKWLDKNTSCPYCRRDIMSSDMESNTMW